MQTAMQLRRANGAKLFGGVGSGWAGYNSNKSGVINEIHGIEKLAILGIIGAASSLAATPSYAVNGAFTKTKNPSYIVVVGLPGTARFGTLSSDFPAGTLIKTKRITSASYVATTYTNGALLQQVKVCMTRQYSTVIDVCENVAAGSTGPVPVFVGKIIAPGVDLFIQHNLTGGTYPTATPATPDQITVNYSY